LERPTNIDKVQEEVENVIKNALRFDEKHSKPIPKFKKVDIKSNDAAVLREEYRLHARETEEREILKQKEINQRDDTEF